MNCEAEIKPVSKRHGNRNAGNCVGLVLRRRDAGLFSLGFQPVAHYTFYIPKHFFAMNDFAQTQQDWRRLLSIKERQTMLGEIANVSLAVGTTLFPSQPWSDFGVTAQENGPKSPLEQLHFIECLLPTLAQTLVQIEQSPLTTAATQARPVLPLRARQVTPAAWMTHARLSQTRRTVNETVAVLSHDTLANRAMKSFLEVLLRDCRAVALLADAEDEPDTGLRAASCAQRLQSLRRASWWEDVAAKLGDWTRPATGREIARPDYAWAARERSRYRRRFGFAWDQPLLTLPPRETWRLYELWCLFTVLRTLQELGWTVTAAREIFAVSAGRLTITLAVGEASKITLRSASGRTLSLTYNRTFAEGEESLTHAMQPDISISDGARVWLLDAKFKPYTEPGEETGDINQMHAYHDAIVGASGTRTVAAAWCLYAGLTGSPNRDQITYGRGIEAPIGALCLRSGDGATQANLRRLLSLWLTEG